MTTSPHVPAHQHCLRFDVADWRIGELLDQLMWERSWEDRLPHAITALIEVGGGSFSLGVDTTDFGRTPDGPLGSRRQLVLADGSVVVVGTLARIRFTRLEAVELPPQAP